MPLHIALMAPLLPSLVALVGVVLWCVSPTQRTAHRK